LSWTSTVWSHAAQEPFALSSSSPSSLLTFIREVDTLASGAMFVMVKKIVNAPLNLQTGNACNPTKSSEASPVAAFFISFLLF